MAFVFQTQRKINQVPKTSNPTAPGQYTIPSANNLTLHQSCAPFNSTLKRLTLFDQKPKIKTGPGEYDISKNIIQPNIKTVSNSHSIIVKINSTGTSQFKSARQRFNKDQTDIPGPGTYNYNSLNHSQSKRKTSMSMYSPKKSIQKKLKSLTQSLKKYPTIPAKIRGLTDMKNQQEIPDAQKLGPAHYNPDKLKHLNFSSTVWGKDKTKRFSLDKSTQVGPGKYKIDFNPIRPEDKIDQPSNQFKSATVRTYFETLYYKTNLSKTARQRDTNHFKTKDPSPGHYQVNKSSFKIKQKPFSFQFFGSTVQRFPQQIVSPTQKVKSSSFYNINSQIGKNRSFNKGINGFNSQTQRTPEFLGIKQKSFTPGPGQYQDKIAVQKKLKAVKVQQFGSTTTRPFHKKQDQSQLGPGKYFNQPSEQDQILKTKFKQVKQISSNFKSTTQRNCFGSTKNEIPLGQYDITQTDIAKKMQKQRNYYENLKKIQVLKAPFQSTHTRFPHYEQTSKQKSPKKISVEQVNKQHQIKIKQQSQKMRAAVIQFNRSQLKDNQVKGYFGKTQRFNDMKKGAPGVGQYKLTNSFEKKSYNVKYSGTNK